MTWDGWCIGSLSHQLCLLQDLAAPCSPSSLRRIYSLPVAAVGAGRGPLQGSSAPNKGNSLYTHFRGNVLRWSQSQMGTELMEGTIVTRKHLQIWMGIFVCVCICVCACVLPTHLSSKSLQLQYCLSSCSTTYFTVYPHVGCMGCASHILMLRCCSYRCFSLLPGAAHPL